MRASFQKKRGKLLSKKQQIISSELSLSKSSIKQPEIPLKINTKDTSIRRALEQAQNMLLEQRQAREDLQRKVTRLQMRGIDRQKQFRRIIQESIPFCIKQKSNAIINTDLKSLHLKLMSFFQATQEQVQQSLMEEKQSQQQQMQRRIQEVTNHAEQQIQQYKRLQSLNYQKIHREISTALANCTAILTQNESMKKQIKELTFNNVILKEERRLLIEETLQKKNLVLKMYGQLKEKYNRDDQIQKEIAVLRKERQKVDKMYENYQLNQRQDADNCFKTIESIRPKAVHLFTTDPTNPTKNTLPYRKNHSHSHNKQKNSSVRFNSTIDVKNRSIYKNSGHRTIATCTSEKEQEGSVTQLKESLKRQRKKNLLQGQKIDYLIGYKRDIDLFVRECYRRGDLETLDQEKVIRLLAGLKKVVEKDPSIQRQILVLSTTEGVTPKEYELLLENY